MKNQIWLCWYPRATMTENSIAEITRNNFMKYKEAFIQAAIRCRKAGFDVVELHAAHGMYLDEVIETSTRNDEYGGSFENRSRLLTELIVAIKETCGCDFIVAVRFGNPNYDELIKTAQAIEKACGDLLDVSSGMNQYQIPIGFNYDSKIYAASLVKAQSHLPVICVGNIFNADDAENILKEDLSDMVAVGRGSLADPFWAKKVLSNMEPNYCRKCKRCMWWIDGNLCPVRKKEAI